MLENELEQIRDQVVSHAPLIHCITNPISINDCANAVLAVGARPIMAEHPLEVADITRTAKALALNLGNITDVRMESMKISAKVAKENKIPFVLDLVGIACSKLRHAYAKELITSHTPTVIKGNMTEIRMFYEGGFSSQGIDARVEDGIDIHENIKLVYELAQKYHCIILASGKTDILSDGQKTYLIHNGCAQLSKITGTGCMLNVLTACYLSVDPTIHGPLVATTTLGICGELSYTECGNGEFHRNLLNHLSILSNQKFQQYLKIEEYDHVS